MAERVKGRIERVVDLIVVNGYVWCHAHGAVHEDKPDPYQEGTNCGDHHCPVYVTKEDLG